MYEFYKKYHIRHGILDIYKSKVENMYNIIYEK